MLKGLLYLIVSLLLLAKPGCALETPEPDENGDVTLPIGGNKESRSRVWRALLCNKDVEAIYRNPIPQIPPLPVRRWTIKSRTESFLPNGNTVLVVLTHVEELPSTTGQALVQWVKIGQYTWRVRKRQSCLVRRLDVLGERRLSELLDMTIEELLDINIVDVENPPQGAACGDPHLRKWNNEFYDYHGECDLVMLHAPTEPALDVHIRTKIQNGYSYIETAAIRLGDDTLEVSGHGQYLLNGVSQGTASSRLEHKSAMTLSGFPLVHEEEIGNSNSVHVFELDLSLSDNFADAVILVVRTVKEIVSVYISGESMDWFGNSTGLMGSFQSGAMLARDGKTVMVDQNEFGQEWMVLDSEPKLFENTNRAPQYPAKCILPSLSSQQRTRRLGEVAVPRMDAETVCAHNSGHDQAMEACVADVIAMNDLEMASTIVY